jgi:hypothetical protein
MNNHSGIDLTGGHPMVPVGAEIELVERDLLLLDRLLEWTLDEIAGVAAWLQ